MRDAELGRALADVRRAVALAHALPRCIIALETAEGETLQVGFRRDACDGQGFVFASLAPVAGIERRLSEGVAELRAAAASSEDDAVEQAEIRLVHDPVLDVSLVFVEYPPLPLLVEGCLEEQAAIGLAAGCLAEELAAELECPGGEPPPPAG